MVWYNTKGTEERVVLRYLINRACSPVVANGRDAAWEFLTSYTKADVVQLTQLLEHSINLLHARSLRIEYKFRVVEDDEHILRG